MFFLHEMLTCHVAERPDKTAFRYMGDDLSFATLDARSTRLAALMQAHGLTRGDRVGLYLHRGLETPVGVFGAFKAGGAFVPLDPFSPIERIALLIRETQMRFLVTHKALAKKVAELVASFEAPITVIGLEEPLPGTTTLSWDDVDSHANALQDPRIVDTDLAYIIFTSGSTGVPKGIMHSHRSGWAFIRNCSGIFGFRSDDTMAALCPLVFDMSLNEYFCGPYLGATVVIVPDGYTRFPASLGKHLAEEGATIFCAVPSLLIQFLEAGAPERFDLSAIRWILTGGEPLSPKYLTAGFKVMPNARYGNLYGPAESNCCSFHVIAPGKEHESEVIPIGRMCPNSDGMIVDENMTPVPAGDSGELLVRSTSVMMGYWQNPERNAVTFHETSGNGGQSQTWLRTGDHVRAREDGVMEYLGRMDRRVKSRGYRVELDEVEAAFSAIDEVIEAAAFLYQADNGENQIGAALTIGQGADTGVAELRKTVSQTLPPYAVPQEIRIIATFPRTQSGKIARRQLSKEFSVTEENAHA